MEKIYKVFLNNQFKLTKENSKSTEFESFNSNEVVYLLPNQELSIVLNPKTVENNEFLKSKSNKMYHNTSMVNFPKRKNKGKQLINFGYSYKFNSEEELDSFLKHLNEKTVTVS